MKKESGIGVFGMKLKELGGEFEVFGGDKRKFKCSVRGVYKLVYDQEYNAICMPCSMATAATIAYRIKSGKLLDFSPQSLINNGVARFEDARSHMVDENMGIQQHCDDPFIHIRCPPNPILPSDHRFTFNECRLIWKRDEMKKQIQYNFGPWGPKYGLVVGVDSQDMESLTNEKALAAWDGEPYTKEMEPMEEKMCFGGHAIVITGLDTSLLFEEQHVVELRNSHGKTWGQEGHSRVNYNFLMPPLLIPVLKGDVDQV